ncbi:MAG TPA: S9 family peptidase [Acidobacteriota bacterium]|nr:S9 family peptidase [Acidobacteriota bacterium]
MHRTLSIHRLLAIGLVVGLIFGAVLAAEGGLTPYDIARLQSVSDAVISPDGRYIAYVLSVPRDPFSEDNGPAYRQLWVLDRQDDSRRPYVLDEAGAGNVAFSPDGKYISFTAKREGDDHTALYAIPVDGGEARKAVQLKSSISGYSWASDSNRVALIASEPEPKEEKELEKKGFNQEIYEEDWRPRRIYIAQAFADEQEPRALDINGSVFDVHWSPVDDRLLVSVAPTPLVDDRYMLKRVLILDANDGSVIVTFANKGKLGQLAWSTDGSHIAFIGGEDINDPREGRLMVAHSAQGAFTDVLNDHKGHVTSIAWQDGDTVMYVNDSGVWTTLEKINADGSGHKKLTNAEGPILGSLSLSDDGQHAAFTAETPEHPSEVYAMSHGDSGPSRYTNSNPWLEERELGAQEVISFKARDGLDLEGILVRPLDEQAGVRYPLILMVHGGPESHHHNGWMTSYSNPAQVMAARGFASFFTNYRGSTGRGVEFSELSQADPAGKEFDDLIDAADHLIETGLVDKDKVGVTGGSYGGYATAWLSTYYSQRIAAGVMFVGISNKISKVGTTDIPDEEFHVHARKRPWDNWQFFLERSPIYYAGQSETPLLILHGKDDPRVNVGQSRELYRHLKLRGKAPVRLVLYPGEEHGNRKAAARLDYSLRSMRWFEHYLKGQGGAPPHHKIEYQPIEP